MLIRGSSVRPQKTDPRASQELTLQKLRKVSEAKDQNDCSLECRGLIQRDPSLNSMREIQSHSVWSEPQSIDRVCKSLALPMESYGTRTVSTSQLRAGQSELYCTTTELIGFEVWLSRSSTMCCRLELACGTVWEYSNFTGSVAAASIDSDGLENDIALRQLCSR